MLQTMKNNFSLVQAGWSLASLLPAVMTFNVNNRNLYEDCFKSNASYLITVVFPTLNLQTADRLHTTQLWPSDPAHWIPPNSSPTPSRSTLLPNLAVVTYPPSAHSDHSPPKLPTQSQTQPVLTSSSMEDHIASCQSHPTPSTTTLTFLNPPTVFPIQP